MAKDKKPFVLRLTPEMMNELEKWAADEFRSVNGQIEYVLSEALKKRKKTSK
ncbi:MAG TPA: Arc family DNA-binding protein [Leadbetterella sp.]|nr:Arc family DNA-binding protein [Leadbetterella sp.]